jgi:nucleotide-binding universal stress UspA family protein
MLNHVLIPLDGSQLAEKAIDVAKTVLKQQGKIFLVTVIQQLSPPIFAYPTADGLHEVEAEAALMENVDSDIRSYIDRVAKNLQLNGYEVEVEIAGGDPADVILALAEKIHVDMIVMSTHGRSGLDRLLFGSVTNKVVNHSHCPVIVVPNREQAKVEDTEAVPVTDPRPAV